MYIAPPRRLIVALPSILNLNPTPCTSTVDYMMSSSFPFYSQFVRGTLLDIISHDEKSTKSSDVHRHVAAGSTILGKQYRDESSSDEDDFQNLNSIDEEDHSSTSASDVEESSDGNVSEENEEQSTTLPVAKNHNPNKFNSVKTFNGGKQHKNDKLFQKLQGKAPVISLSVPSSSPDDAEKQPKALQIPTILLPTHYIRDNPNWEASSAAKILLNTWDNLHSSSANIIIVLLQSGRFVATVYTLKTTIHNKVPQLTMIAHKTSTRYTIRKGQGGSQSSHDSSKNKAKSVGAQLRREGEKQLREDVVNTWKLWKVSNYIQNAVGVFVSCPKGMRREYLFGDGNVNAALVEKGDERLRSIPLDVGRPTLEGAKVALDCLMSCNIVNLDMASVSNADAATNEDENNKSPIVDENEKSKESEATKELEKKDDYPPLTPLHEAVIEGDLSKLMELLTVLEEVEENENTTTEDEDNVVETPSYDVDSQGGQDNQTALHFAAASNHQNAPSLLTALLVNGHANPCSIDSRGRPPYFVAASDKVREAFRLARGKLGEEYCRWDDAKVGPALSDADVQAKKAKALEKKRKQRARQKEKKALEKARAEEEAAKKREEEEKKKQVEDAKRVRDGLKPKSSTASNICDFCQKAAKVKRRSQMFQRLNYYYCSTDCVKKHQRELMAAAAAARMGG